MVLSGFACHRRQAADQQGAMLCFLLGNLWPKQSKNAKGIIKQAIEVDTCKRGNAID